MTGTREGKGEKIGSETSHSGREVSWIYSVSSGKYWDRAINYGATTAFHIISIHYSLIILQFDAVVLFSEILNASLNKPRISS
jgi:hypothetical protein